MARSGGRGMCLDELTSYIQTGLTGTGSSQNVAHNLGCVPDLVIVSLRDTIGAANQYTIGTSTTANLVVTVTSSAVFDILAFKFKAPA